MNRNILVRDNGFTLVELLTTIAILSVLAGGIILVINPIGVLQKARDARRKNDLEQIQKELELYYNNHGRYPSAVNSGNTCADGAVGGCWVFSTYDGTNWINGLSIYGALPVDPINNSSNSYTTGNYSYGYGNISSDGQHYDLFAQLENQSDPQRCGLMDYLNGYGLLGGPWHWCPGDSGNNFGGGASNYIFQINHE